MTLTGNTFSFSWEVSLMRWLQAHFGPEGIYVLSFFSVFGYELMLILILGFVYCGYSKRLGKTVGLSVLMGLVWNPMIKNIFLRRRPYFDHDGIEILRVVEPGADIYDISAQGYSFPSGHSTNAMSVYGSLAAGTRKKWLAVLAAALPLLVGVSRVVVGAHYPTDVLAGWLIGVAAIVVIPWLQSRVRNTALLYGILLATAIPGFFYCKSADYFTGVGLLIGFMGGSLLEEKYVKFDNTKSPLRVALRLLGGVALYFLLNKLLKLPFSKEFLDGGSLSALMVRSARYAVIAFLEFGVYPVGFRYTARIGAGKNSAAIQG